MSNLNLITKFSADELLQCLQEDINDLVITQKIDEDIAESHMNVAKELHELAVRYEGIINLLKSRA
jgi:hypothetical protein